jgi:diphosphomevalonate decarboxylase
LALKRKRRFFSRFDLLLKGILRDFKPNFLERIEIYLPFFKDYHFTIDTENTFPHSSELRHQHQEALAMNLMSLKR